MPDEPLVLGIETSCDETGVGIVRGHTLLADALASSVEQHARFGGVVPEVASRAHLEAIGPTMRRALDEAGVALAALGGSAGTRVRGGGGGRRGGAGAGGGGAGGEGLRGGGAKADLRRQPSRRARGGGHAGA